MMQDRQEAERHGRSDAYATDVIEVTFLIDLVRSRNRYNDMKYVGKARNWYTPGKFGLTIGGCLFSANWVAPL